MILKATYYCYLMRRFLYHFTFACYDVMVLDFLYLCEINLHIYIYITMYILCILPNFIAILLLVLNRISIFQLFPFWCPYYLPVLPCFGGWNHIFYLKVNSSQVWCTYHLANQFRRRITKYGKTDRGECLKKEDPSQDLDFQCHISWPSLCSVS